jgi:hypothetical protein
MAPQNWTFPRHRNRKWAEQLHRSDMVLQCPRDLKNARYAGRKERRKKGKAVSKNG